MSSRVHQEPLVRLKKGGETTEILAPRFQVTGGALAWQPFADNESVAYITHWLGWAFGVELAK